MILRNFGLHCEILQAIATVRVAKFFKKATRVGRNWGIRVLRRIKGHWSLIGEVISNFPFSWKRKMRETWTQVRRDSLDLFQISLDYEITDACASGQRSGWSDWLQFLFLYGIVDGLFSNKFHEYKNSQKSKICNDLEEKWGVLTLPLLNSRGSLNVDMLQPIFKSLSQSFLAQRNKSR